MSSPPIFAIPTARLGAPAVRQAEVLAALSRALDLTEGQPDGHTLRSCAIGMRLADDLQLPVADSEALYFALLLKDAGCSSNAARMAALFGSADQEVKYGMKLVDWHNRLRLAIRTFRMVGRGESIASRVNHFLRIATTAEMTKELIQIRCDRGADIALRLGFPSQTAEAVRSLDEHWCGLGYPDGKRGDEIPLLARIANLAQTVEIHFTRVGANRAIDLARRRSGTWFDPQLVRILTTWKGDSDWWNGLNSPQLKGSVVALEPGERPRRSNDASLDSIAQAFADIIDAKSPHTYRHSSNVAAFASGIARELGFDAPTRKLLYRAGLLHDIGKLGISSRILDKNGPLTPGERQEIERHPEYSWQILSHVEAFLPFARVAVLHHEKLDGSGYPWGLRGDALGPTERALCVADIFEALTADRPYRAGLAPEEAMRILRKDTPAKLCSDTVEALEASLAEGCDVAGRESAPYLEALA